MIEYNQYAASQTHYDGKEESTDVIALNKQGYAPRQPNGYPATYDKEGYSLTLKNKGEKRKLIGAM